jgi:hypothetical protein
VGSVGFSSSTGGRVTRQPVPISLRRSVAAYGRRSGLDENLPRVKRAFRQVRKELAEVGLLHNGGYLGNIELCISSWPSKNTAGFIFDEGVNSLDAKMGYKPGVIYLPLNVPHRRYCPGYTLVDTIRHEFAHAWHWVEPAFFRRPWFVETFGAAYVNLSSKPLESWRRRKFQSSGFVRQWEGGADEEQEELIQQHMLNDFATDYATLMASEDFAETFMYYLKYRNSLDRFRSRRGFYRKLKSVESAVRTARRELGL